MTKPEFAELDVPPEALRLSPTVAEVDAHPDRLFIWAVIRETRRACRSPDRRTPPRPLME